MSEYIKKELIELNKLQLKHHPCFRVRSEKLGVIDQLLNGQAAINALYTPKKYIHYVLNKDSGYHDYASVFVLSDKDQALIEKYWRIT